MELKESLKDNPHALAIADALIGFRRERAADTDHPSKTNWATHHVKGGTGYAKNLLRAMCPDKETINVLRDIGIIRGNWMSQHPDLHHILVEDIFPLVDEGKVSTEEFHDIVVGSYKMIVILFDEDPNTAKYSDLLSDGGMDPRTEYERTR